MVRRIAWPLVLPLLWPARTRIKVFVRTCSSASCWQLCVGCCLLRRRVFLEKFQSRMLLPTEVAAVFRKSDRNLVATTIRDCCAVRGQVLALSVRR